MRATLLSALLLLGPIVPAYAEWQIKPFVGAKFGGSTTLLDTDSASGVKKIAFGASGALLGELFGVEADFARINRFFGKETRSNVLKSSLTTLTGNLMVAMPRRLTEYTLRPYFVGGAGLLFARNDQFIKPFSYSLNLPAIDVGGGVTGFLTPRIGINWDLRHFRSFGGNIGGAAITAEDREELSFWRANMALAIRY